MNNVFVKVKNGVTYDNTAEGALFPSAELGKGRRFGPFNHPRVGKEVTLLATIDVEAKCLNIKVIDGDAVIGTGELRPSGLSGPLSYAGSIDGVAVVGFRGTLKGGGLFIQIRPDTRVGTTATPTGHLAVALANCGE